MSSKRGGGGGGGLIKGVGRAPGRNYVQVRSDTWLGRRARKKGARLTCLIAEFAIQQASQAARLQKAQKSSAINTRIRMEGDEFDSRFGYAAPNDNRLTRISCLAP
jgi:hypothetical protein